jgi:hypothetical protein
MHVAHITEAWIVLPLLAAAGLGLPVLLQRVAEVNKLSRRLVLGDWRMAFAGSRSRQETTADSAASAPAWSVGATSLLEGRWKTLGRTQRASPNT